ncbi:hypothetical protein QJS10_CPA03g00613 [Acorus calamus]|uniref:Uncharacterized protein n=1 Tax=Acorus calamus TaxID=4465 RepID=A0AAV9F918_ACOCL|nr:hypothetical protein QJS10_CPA03g00613 [Acorus calamus]
MDSQKERERSSRKTSRDDRVEREEKEHHHHHHHRRDSDRDHDREHKHHRSKDSRHHHREEDHEARREKSHDRSRGRREESEERGRESSSRKRKDHEEEVDEDKAGKRVRVSEERREKRRFEDSGSNGVHGEGRRSKDRGKEVEEEVKKVHKEERREKRKFGDRAEEEEEEEGIRVSKEVKSVDGEPRSTDASDASGLTANGAVLETLSVVSKIVPNTSGPSTPNFPIKVSSITTTNQNEDNITRSDEVPGKSSTDGTLNSTSGKNGLSLDALAKAKKALQKQKELSEKLKKIPVLNKSSSSISDGALQAASNKQSLKIPTSHYMSPVHATTVPATSAQALPATSDQAVGAASSTKTSAGGMASFPAVTTVANYEAVRRAQELAAKMGFRQDPEFAPLINMFPGPAPAETSLQHKPAKAPVLRLDALGREIDEHGNVIDKPKLTNLSTLKVNINKQKKEAFQILRPELDENVEKNPYFDMGMGINKTKLLRPKRMAFQFVEEGKWSKDAEIIRFKSQFGEARAKELKIKQAQLAKAKAEPDINPNLIEVSERVIVKEKKKDPIPEVEWWDLPLLTSGSYGDGTEDKLNMDKINIYVEHPLPIEPPAEPAPPPPQPLKLTKKEQKKLRTQRRLAKERDRQEMIRQGLIEPPKPKVKMSNLMKVLGAEATQDPTKLEMEIRSAAAEREQAHVDRNIARKLTPAERREKKEKKLFEDSSTLETIVSVYRINDLSHPQTRFKVDVNAQENRLSGCVVISEGMSVVVVEGGRKSIKRYGKLMLNRINWAAAVNDEDGDEGAEAPVNKCVLVWQGSVAKPSFNRFFIHQCRTEAAAKKVFADAGVAHYWDMAVNFSDDQV